MLFRSMGMEASESADSWWVSAWAAAALLAPAASILVVTIDKRQEAGRTIIENWAHPARAREALAELEGM